MSLTYEKVDQMATHAMTREQRTISCEVAAYYQCQTCAMLYYMYAASQLLYNARHEFFYYIVDNMKESAYYIIYYETPTNPMEAVRKGPKGPLHCHYCHSKTCEHIEYIHCQVFKNIFPHGEMHISDPFMGVEEQVISDFLL